MSRPKHEAQHSSEQHSFPDGLSGHRLRLPQRVRRSDARRTPGGSQAAAASRAQHDRGAESAPDRAAREVEDVATKREAHPPATRSERNGHEDSISAIRVYDPRGPQRAGE